MNTKDIAVDFLQLISKGEVEEAYTYVAENFLHHNPNFKGDAETFAKVMQERHQQFPDKTYEVKHILSDGDLVAVHGRVQIGEKVTALVHVFRFENDKIAELWDIGEEIPKDSLNENGAF